MAAVMFVAVAGCSIGADASPLRHEPYPFTGARTLTKGPFDGTYGRVVPSSVLGGDAPCRRCPPYRLELGPDVLGLEGGVFRLYHWDSGYVAVGNYVVDDGRVTLFNDASCPSAHGAYTVDATDRSISFDAIDDTCAYDNIRSRYFEAASWILLSKPEGAYLDANGGRLLILDGEFVIESPAGQERSGTYGVSGSTITVTLDGCEESFRWEVGDRGLRLRSREGTCDVDLPSLVWQSAT
jgi:hypothetical protein